MADFLHQSRDFAQLLAVVANDRGLDPMLVEKDYWIMHALWSLQAQGFLFELKGGTSLSKGFGVIHRFSEDIDIRIEPPADMTRPIKPRRAISRSRSPARKRIKTSRNWCISIFLRPIAPPEQKIQRVTMCPVRDVSSAVQAGSNMPKTPWLLYAENALAPICRKPIGLYMPKSDTNGHLAWGKMR